MPAYANRAWVKYKSGDFNGAIDDSNKVLNIEPDNGYVLDTRGMAKYNLIDLLNACLDLKSAAALEIKETLEYLNSKEGSWCKKD